MKLSVRVHNYSFMRLEGPVDVRFYLGDPDGGRWGSDENGDFILDNVGFQPLVGTAGQSFVSTADSGIPPRDDQTVTMEWVVGYGLSGSLPNNSWIYAVIDPRGAAEIHSPLQVASNNKGFAGIIVKDGPIAVDAPQSLSRTSALGQNFPNPFNPSTSIYFTLERPGFASLKIYDRAGRMVATLVNEDLTAGKHRCQWNGCDKQGSQVASGVYFYQLKSGEFVQTRRMLLLK